MTQRAGVLAGGKGSASFLSLTHSSPALFLLGAPHHHQPHAGGCPTLLRALPAQRGPAREHASPLTARCGKNLPPPCVAHSPLHRPLLVQHDRGECEERKGRGGGGRPLLRKLGATAPPKMRAAAPDPQPPPSLRPPPHPAPSPPSAVLGRVRASQGDSAFRRPVVYPPSPLSLPVTIKLFYCYTR